MLKFKPTKLALAASVILVSINATAEEQVVTSTLEISNAFTLTENSALSFGTVRASQAYTASTNGTGALAGDEEVNPAGVRILPDGSTPVELSSSYTADTGVNTASGSLESSVTIILPGSAATYSISGAAPNTALYILNTTTDLSVDNGVGDANDFVLNIGYSDMRVTTGPNANTAYDNADSNLVTDGVGDVSFAIGGELRINPAANATLAEGTYSGTYSVIVSY